MKRKSKEEGKYNKVEEGNQEIIHMDWDERWDFDSSKETFPTEDDTW